MEYKKVKRKNENKNKTAKQENTQNKQNEIARKASNAERDINTQGHKTKVQKKILIKNNLATSPPFPALQAMFKKQRRTPFKHCAAAQRPWA